MKLDMASLKQIVDNSDEITVFGLRSCLYMKLIDELRHNDFIVNFHSSHRSFDLIDFDDDGCIKREFKAIITSLIFENYKRIKEGKKLIPLIFCVELEKETNANYRSILTSLNIEKVASSRVGYTDSELRRCYKIFNIDELKIIAQNTFKFVKLVEYSDKRYSVIQVPSFWENQIWERRWNERHLSANQANVNKNYPWRKTLNSEISKYNSKHNFFHAEVNSEDRTSNTGMIAKRSLNTLCIRKG